MEGRIREYTLAHAPAFGFRVSGVGFRVSGSGFRFSGFGSRVSGFVLQVSCFGFRVSVPRKGVNGSKTDRNKRVTSGLVRERPKVCTGHVLYVCRIAVPVDRHVLRGGDRCATPLGQSRYQTSEFPADLPTHNRARVHLAWFVVCGVGFGICG